LGLFEPRWNSKFENRRQNGKYKKKENRNHWVVSLPRPNPSTPMWAAALSHRGPIDSRVDMRAPPGSALSCDGPQGQSHLPTPRALGTKSAAAQQTTENPKNAGTPTRKSNLMGARMKPSARHLISPVLLDCRVENPNPTAATYPHHRTQESPSIGPSGWLRRVVGLCPNLRRASVCYGDPRCRHNFSSAWSVPSPGHCTVPSPRHRTDTCMDAPLASPWSSQFVDRVADEP
jgi:hypothetical protein